MAARSPAAVARRRPPDEVRGEYRLHEAFQPGLLPCITPLPNEAATPDPLISPPGREGHSSVYLYTARITCPFNDQGRML